MIVTVSGVSGLTNAYRSELSATGSLLISGASRCDDMALGPLGGQRWTALSNCAASFLSVSVVFEAPEKTSNVPFLASRREITSGALTAAAVVVAVSFVPARLKPATPATETPTPAVAAMGRTLRRDRRLSAIRLRYRTRLMLGLSSCLSGGWCCVDALQYEA